MKTFPVRVKHGWCFQNTNYNWIVSWNLLKALVWLIYLPSTLCCWSECQPLNWLNFAFPERLTRAFSSCMWEQLMILKDNVTNKITFLLMLSTLTDYFTEQKWTLCSVHHNVNCAIHTASGKVLLTILLILLNDPIIFLDFLLSGRYYFGFLGCHLLGDASRRLPPTPLKEKFYKSLNMLTNQCFTFGSKYSKGKI